MKILVFIDHFQFGGAARVTSSMCNGLVQEGHDVSIAMDILNYSILYPLDERIKLISSVEAKNASKRSVLSRLMKLISLICSSRRIVRQQKPDLVIAVLSDIFFIVKIAMVGMDIPVIACDHTSFERKSKRWITQFVRTYFYKTADALTILTKKDEKLLGGRFPNKRVIYNPLPFDVLDEQTQRRKNVLCAGRLDAWEIKGYDTMISIWKNLAVTFPDWVLEIAGYGSPQAYDELNAMICQAGLQGRVILLGQLDDMKDLYSHTSVFAMPSRLEGFGMVLLEAMSQGCACVTFDVGGAEEMILNNGAGNIVPSGDIEGFKNSLAEIMRNDHLRAEMSRLAIADAQKFSQERFIAQWAQLIDDVSRKGK